jgi:sulfur-oxidizing protein SoxZ
VDRKEMSEPTRIRAQAQGGKITVRVLMSHEMESGHRKDGSGKIVPSWFIQEVSISLNGKVILDADFGPSVSKNPYLQFVIKGGKTGDKLSLAWKDNRGQTRTDEASVS